MFKLKPFLTNNVSKYLFKLYSENIITVCYVVYFRLCNDLMHITSPVTAEGFNGSHHPKYAEWVAKYIITTHARLLRSVIFQEVDLKQIHVLSDTLWLTFILISV